jgi:chromosome segregation ATPase
LSDIHRPDREARDRAERYQTIEVLEAEHNRLVAEWKDLVNEQLLVVKHQTQEGFARLAHIHNRLQSILDRQWEIQQAIFEEWSGQN